jgi:hypothetical protein
VLRVASEGVGLHARDLEKARLSDRIIHGATCVDHDRQDVHVVHGRPVTFGSTRAAGTAVLHLDTGPKVGVLLLQCMEEGCEVLWSQLQQILHGPCAISVTAPCVCNGCRI